MLRWNIVTSPVDQVVIIGPGLLITLPCDGYALPKSSHAVGFHLRCSQTCSALVVFGRAMPSGKVSLTDRLFVSISGFFLPRTCGFLCGLTVTLFFFSNSRLQQRHCRGQLSLTCQCALKNTLTIEAYGLFGSKMIPELRSLAFSKKIISILRCN